MSPPHLSLRCERYGVVPLARMVQQKQYSHGLPMDGSDSDRGRKPSGARRKRPRQGLGRGPGLRRARRPVTTQQVQDTGASSPASARDEAEPTAGHAASWGELEPGLPTVVATSGQELAGGQQGPGASPQPTLKARHEDSSIASSLATEPCEAVPARPGDGHRQQSEWGLGAARVGAGLSWGLSGFGLVTLDVLALLRPGEDVQVLQAAG